MKKQQQSSGWSISPPSTVFKSSVANIESGNARCERTGHEMNFYRFDFPDWVNVIALTVDNEMVLVRQYRFGSERVELEIPGGVINNNESVIDAGCRELLEETGYVGKKAHLIGEVCPNPALQKNRCYTVLVEDAEHVSQQMLDETEDIEVKTLPVKKVYEAIRKGQIHHGLVINALYFYLEYSGDRSLT